MPFRRTLVIALAILGLIVPGGLAMTVRLCETGVPSLAVSADCGMTCCGPARYGDHGLDHPVARQIPCDGCYFFPVHTPERAEPATTHAGQLHSPALSWQHGTPVLQSIPTARDGLALRRCELSPPGRFQNLPLRL